MKKFCAILFSFVLVLMLALPVAAEDAAGESDSLFDTAPALTAPAGYVVNLDTNIVVYEKNSETPLSAASLTKLMTTLLLLENYQDQLDSISLTAPSYIYDLIWEQSTNASTADIRRGETQSLRNLLYAAWDCVFAVIVSPFFGFVVSAENHCSQCGRPRGGKWLEITPREHRNEIQRTCKTGPESVKKRVFRAKNLQKRTGSKFVSP